MLNLKLSKTELNSLRILLDSDHRRVLIECAEALDNPTSYAGMINNIRNQVIYLTDKAFN
jgi:hypothetical protein